MGKVLHNPCRPGVPTASERGAESEVAHKWAKWLHNPAAAWGVPTASERGAESEVAHKWAKCYITPTALGFRPLQSGGHNQKWPTNGQGGYITLAAWGVPTSSEQEAESEVAHKWAWWLHNPCRLGCPYGFRAGGRIRSGSSQKGEILFLGGHATKRGFQSGGTISEIAHKWAQWQSEVGKLIFWVRH